MKQSQPISQVEANRQSARRLMSAIRINEEDRKWCHETGGTIIYAVDNDIVKLYSDTKAMALGADGEGGYTRIFSADKDAHTIGIGRILSHFIFFGSSDSRTQQLPLFWIPPLDEEFATMFSGVFRNAGSEINRAQHAAVRVDGQIKDAAKSDADVTRYLIEHAPDVVSILLGGESGQTELLRLCGLVNEGKVLPLNEVDSIAEQLPSDFVAATTLKLSLFDLIWLSELREEWISRLIKSGDDAKKKEKLGVDADALARLQLLNRRLEGTNIRILMITGAPRVMNIAHGMPGRDETQSFADSWLRHPRGFLGEPDIFRGNRRLDEEFNTNRLPEMLDAFLAETNEKQGKQYSHDTDHQYGEAMSTLQSNWDQLSAGLCLAHPEILRSPSNDLSDEVIALVAKIRAADSTIKQFLVDAWHAAFLAAMQTGFLFSWSLRRDMRRNVPQLVFESFGDASRFIHELLVQMQRMPGTGIENFRERISKVRGDGSGGYTTYLVFGVLFAAQDLWHVASSLADCALHRIFPDMRFLLQHALEDQERLITGREALYLKAVAGRHLARSVRDLVVAHDAILLAEQVLRLERERRGRGLLQGDHRFRYERCSINVAAAMFEKFMSEPGLGSTGMSVREMQNELTEILQSTLEESDEEVCSGSCHLQSRVLTSLFIIELILIARPGDLFPERLREKLEKYKKLYTGTHIGNPTKLAQAVFSVADCWGETNLNQVQAKRVNALANIDIAEKTVRPGESMPYEYERYNYLRHFLIQIGKPSQLG